MPVDTSDVVSLALAKEAIEYAVANWRYFVCCHTTALKDLKEGEIQWKVDIDSETGKGTVTATISTSVAFRPFQSLTLQEIVGWYLFCREEEEEHAWESEYASDVYDDDIYLDYNDDSSRETDDDDIRFPFFK
jgi:hypothetical protein